MTVTLKPIKAAMLTIEDSEPIHVEYLGKGQFSEAWRNCASVYVVIHERTWGQDTAKAVLASLNHGDGSLSPHIPRVDYVGELSQRGAFGNSTEAQVYRMPLYQPLTKAHKTAWAQFRELERVKNGAWAQLYMPRYRTVNKYTLADEVVNHVIDNANVTDDLREALQEIRDAACNYMGQPMFEFSKKNLCVDSDGNLVLLDILFDIDVLDACQDAQRKAMERTHRGY